MHQFTSLPRPDTDHDIDCRRRSSLIVAAACLLLTPRCANLTVAGTYFVENKNLRNVRDQTSQVTSYLAQYFETGIKKVQDERVFKILLEVLKNNWILLRERSRIVAVRGRYQSVVSALSWLTSLLCSCLGNPPRGRPAEEHTTDKSP